MSPDSSGVTVVCQSGLYLTSPLYKVKVLLTTKPERKEKGNIRSNQD